MGTIMTNCLPAPEKKRNLKLYSLIGTLLLVFFSANLFAQTISFPTSCTSKDLTLLQASLPAPSGNRCACSGDRSLILGIHNGTGSTRTSFALWGTLIRKNAAGVVTSTDQIFACAGPISPSGDYFLNATTIKINGTDVPVASVVTSSGTLTLPVIHIECGESLDIVDMHLAWTAATPGSTCASLYNSPGTINPKCGIQELIRVDLGVDGNLTTNSATCTTGGKIRVAPFGGIGPYEVKLDNGNYIPVPVNPGYYEFTNVSAGQHTVTIRDNTTKPEAERCTATKTPTVGSTTPPTAAIGANRTTVTCTNTSATLTASGGGTYSWSTGATTAAITVSPTTTTTYTVTVTGTNGCTDQKSQQIIVNKNLPSFTVCLVQPSLCSGQNSGGQVIVNASNGTNFSYKLNDGNLQCSNVFSNLGAGSVSSITVLNTDNGCPTTVNCGDFQISNSCVANSCVAQAQTKRSSSEVTTLEVQPTVKAYPNPFNDRVKFVINSPAAGNGSLDVYNVMGQKVKTVYQGRINTGDQSFEITLPKKQQQTLIYMLTVDGKKVTGKLLQLNK
jgi:hypothetical protein